MNYKRNGVYSQHKTQSGMVKYDADPDFLNQRTLNRPMVRYYTDNSIREEL
jgi:hypothetical protein